MKSVPIRMLVVLALVSLGAPLALGPGTRASAIQTAWVQPANDDGYRADNRMPNVEVFVTASATVTPTAVEIVAGLLFSCALFDTGSVSCWGRNDWGQLGDGTNNDRSVPVDVLGVSGAVSISAGINHACALLANGGIRCWGGNSEGQLGDGTNSNRAASVRVTSLGGVAVAVSAGDRHTCAIMDTGRLKCWGYNSLYQLGAGDYSTHYSPITATAIVSPVIAVAAGEYHTCVIVDLGGVRCWGYNTQGQLGTGSSSATVSEVPLVPTGLSSGVTRIFARQSTTCAVLADGSERCWGYNTAGQLGNDGFSTTCNSGACVPYPVPVSGLTEAVSRGSLGFSHGCALQREGVLCWGSDSGGQLGNRQNYAYAFNPFPVWGLASGATDVAAGAEHSCAIVRGGVVCWGYSQFGQIGSGQFVNSRFLPKAVIGLEPAAETIASCSFEGFEVSPPSDWTRINRSQPLGISEWSAGNTVIFTAANGTLGSYIAVGADSTSGEGTISNWLISPVITVTNGDRVAFWTRKVSPDDYPDRLQLRLSLSGDSVDVGNDASSVGDFTDLLLEIDPGLKKKTYPTVWQPFTLTLDSITGTVAARFAFRYFVTSGGPGGVNSDYLGVDSFSYCAPYGFPVTSTPTPTTTPTRTPTPPPSPTPTRTPTATATPSVAATQTPTSSPTSTPTVITPATETPTATPTSTTTGTATETSTPTATQTGTPTPTPTQPPAGSASIGDRVWFDLNGNGRQDGGEPGVGAADVGLLRWNDIDAYDLVISHTTSVTGFYQFTGLAAGEYIVRFTAPPGYGFTVRDSADATDNTDSDTSVATGETGPYVLAESQSIRNVDAGVVPVASPTPTSTPQLSPVAFLPLLTR